MTNAAAAEVIERDETGMRVGLPLCTRCGLPILPIGGCLIHPEHEMTVEDVSAIAADDVDRRLAAEWLDDRARRGISSKPRRVVDAPLPEPAATEAAPNPQTDLWGRTTDR